MDEFIEHLQTYSMPVQIEVIETKLESPYQWFSNEDTEDLKNIIITGKLIAEMIYKFSTESGINKQDTTSYILELMEILNNEI